MKLSVLRFDDVVTIPGGKLVGDGLFTEACEQQYRAVDGWELHEKAPGVFSMRASHMSRAVTVGGYGYYYEEAPITVSVEPVVVEPPKGKKR